MKDETVTFSPAHIAPSIMISGKPNHHLVKIKQALESRYCINVLCDLFASTYHPFSSKLINKIRSIQERKIPLTAADVFGDSEKISSDDYNLPF